MINTDIFDKEGLLKNLGGDESIMEELIEVFIDDVKVRLEKLEPMIEEKNMKEINEIAHSIKGAADNIKAHNIREIAFDLEKSADRGEGDMEVMFEELKKEFNKFLSYYEEK